MDIQFPEILFQMINFGVVAGALTFLLYKPILKMLDERSAKIEEGQKAAEVVIAEKQHIEETKKKVQRDAEKAADTVLLEAKQTASTMEQNLLAEAKRKAKAEIEKDLQNWEAEKADLRKQMKATFVSEVFAVTEKVLGSAVDEKTLSKKLDQDIAEAIAKI